eukprot:3143792-Prorocentrum_lima.AAC.1
MVLGDVQTLKCSTAPSLCSVSASSSLFHHTSLSYRYLCASQRSWVGETVSLARGLTVDVDLVVPRRA